MSTDPVHRLSQLAELMRARMAERARQRGSIPNGLMAQLPESAVQKGKSDIGQLRTAVKQSVCAVDVSDPCWEKRARKVFLENVMAWHFGTAVLNDVETEKILDELDAAFEQNSALQTKLSAVFVWLKEG